MRYTRTDLEGKTVKELLDMAKGKQVVGRHNMKKDQLINALLKVEFEASEAPQEENQKLNYIKNIRPGIIIAFKINETRVVSGKVDKVYADHLIVETKNGARFNVLKKDIIWVKTGQRWPKGVYLALKGVSPDGGCQAIN